MQKTAQDSLELVLRAGFQRLVTLWLTLFSLVCALLVAVDPWWPAFSVQQVWLLIGLHHGLFVLLIIFCTLPWGKAGGSYYIRDHYPEIWQKLGPQGLFSRNSLVTLPFTFGAYDDGQDAFLQLIKRRYRRMLIFSLWLLALFFLPLPVIAIRELVLIFVTPLRAF